VVAVIGVLESTPGPTARYPMGILFVGGPGIECPGRALRHSPAVQVPSSYK
jgi:hypothetical protein